MIKVKDKIKKILLVFPPVVFSRESPKQIMPPLGISSLAAFLGNEFEVRLLDAAVEGYETERVINKRFLRYGLTDEQIKQRISDFTPDVTGVSCLYSSQFSQAIRICEISKAILPDTITVIGGAHPTFLPELCLVHKCLDFIIMGEGELSLKELLLYMNSGKPIVNVEGIAFRVNGSVKINPSRCLIENLDFLPFPARHLLPLKKYFDIDMPMGLVSRQHPPINLITSRGCPFQCSFCSSCHYWGDRYRARSVENVLREMESLKEMGIRELKFFDDNLTYDSERAKKIFKSMVHKKFGFTWNCPNGIAASTLDEEMIKLMKDSGCYEITLAIESGDQEVLTNLLKKPVDLKKIKEITSLIKKNNINTYGFFIIGFPGETKQQIYNTLNFIDNLKLDRISLFIANPLPGTEIYKECIKKGYIKEFAEEACFDYFQAAFDTEFFDRAFLEKLRRSWYWKYNAKLLIRDPLKFFRMYAVFLFKNPLLLLRIVFQKFIIPMIRP